MGVRSAGRLWQWLLLLCAASAVGTKRVDICQGSMRLLDASLHGSTHYAWLRHATRWHTCHGAAG